MGWEIVVPIVILLWGVSLLADVFWFRKKKHRVVKKNHKEGSREYSCENGEVHCEMSFGSDRASVTTELLHSGEIETSFGQFTVDFSACRAVAPNCKLEVENSFGSLILLIPRRFRVHIVESENFFSGCTVKGECDVQTVGDIFLNFENSFGSLTVQYIE